MHLLRSSTLAVACLPAFAAPALSHAAAQAAPPPNVLLIMVDDLFADIGPYGNTHIQTPNLDRLAQSGVTLERAYANYPLCGPSRNSMLTGRYAEDTQLPGLRDLARKKHPNIVTLPQHFTNNGYTAARVGKIFHSGNPDGIGKADHDDPQSWQIAINPKGRDKDIEDKIHRVSGVREGMKLRSGLGAQLSWYADPDGTDLEHTDGIVASEAIRLMEQFAQKKEPFFLGVGFYKPHTPFVAPKAYFDLYNPADLPLPKLPDNYLDTLPEPAVKSIRKAMQADIPEPIAREIIRAYYATITYLDANIGRVLDALERLGLAENTIIVFASDHGYHMGEHGHWQKHTLFEQSDRTPIIIAAPSLKGGKRSTEIVEMVDIYRTLSELAGLPEPEWTSGKSFVPVLKGEGSGRPSAISAITQDRGRHYTLRTPNWRYTRWGKGGKGMIELYDLGTDPAELHNLANDAKYAKQIRKLDGELSERVAELPKPPPGLRQ